jgi:hypothetical protein
MMFRKYLAAAAALIISISVAIPGAAFAEVQPASSPAMKTASTRTVKTNGPGMIVVNAPGDATITTNIPGEEQINLDNTFLDNLNHNYGIQITSTTPQTYTISGEINSCRFCSSADRTVVSGKTYYIGAPYSDGVSKEYWNFTYKAPSNGYIQVITKGYDKEDYPVFATQIFRNGKSLSSKDEYGYMAANAIRTYGVEKGKKYVIRVKPTTSLFWTYTYYFRVNFKAVKAYKNQSKRKAKTIKAKKLMKGTIPVGSAQTNWYKFTVKKNKTIKVMLKGATNGQLNFLITHKVGKKTKKYTKTIYHSDKTSLEVSADPYIGTKTKGTWYIQVRGATKKSSGYYQIKWK